MMLDHRPARRSPGRRPIALGLAAVLLLGSCSDDGSDSSKPDQTTTTEAPSSGVGEPGSPGTITDLSGSDLTKAIASLQKAGFLQIEAVDVTGDGREVGVDEPWLVAAQSVPATRVDDAAATPITLFVTRKGEVAGSPADLGFTQVPDLLYQPLGSGLDLLVGLGLTDVAITDYSGGDRSVPTDDSWTVLSQAPVPDAWLKPGQQVQLAALPATEAPAEDGG